MDTIEIILKNTEKKSRGGHLYKGELSPEYNFNDYLPQILVPESEQEISKLCEALIKGQNTTFYLLFQENFSEKKVVLKKVAEKVLGVYQVSNVKPQVAWLKHVSKNCGLGDSDDPPCIFLRRGPGCSKRSIAPDKIISGILNVKLWSDEMARNALRLEVYSCVNKELIKRVYKDTITVSPTNFDWSPPSSEDEDYFIPFEQEWQFDRESTETEVCYLVEIKWFFKEKLGLEGRGKLNVYCFSIGDEKHLPDWHSCRFNIPWTPVI